MAVTLGGVWKKVSNDHRNPDDIQCRVCGKEIEPGETCYSKISGNGRGHPKKFYYCEVCFQRLWI